jgi:secernin
MNEFGVAIGNEGIWTRVLARDVAAAQAGRGPELGPTGMDLLRLGLERGRTARQALEVITSLLEPHGQFGSGIPTMGVAEGAYHNSYIIADPREAWVLETAGRHWVARRLDSGSTSISNTPSIDAQWDLASSSLVQEAVNEGWWPSDRTDALDFTLAYGDDGPVGQARRARSMARAACSSRLLEDRHGSVTPQWMMRIARDESSTPPINLDVTASSCVAVLPQSQDELPVFWWCPSRERRAEAFVRRAVSRRTRSTRTPSGGSSAICTIEPRAAWRTGPRRCALCSTRSRRISSRGCPT